jgi:triosephosphate isomerase
MTKKYIIGNWKMNLNVQQASFLLHALNERVSAPRETEVVIAPHFIALQPLSLQVNHRKLKLAAQNCYWRDEGAFTGEISASMLRGLVKYVILGHSERRHIFGETNDTIRHKMQAAVRNHLTPILCIGETGQERADGDMTYVLHDQLMAGLANLTSEEIESIIIAYEPVWAIGTGNSATPKDVAEAIAAIRHQIKELYGKHASEIVPVLYGGCVTADNARLYINTKGVDGLLVGGASLHIEQFIQIIDSTKQTA